MTPMWLLKVTEGMWRDAGSSEIKRPGIARLQNLRCLGAHFQQNLIIVTAVLL